jgi:hypothetical protein
MRLMCCVLALIVIGQGAIIFGARFNGNKTEAEIARMTPQQRVEEYCKEYVRHAYLDVDYEDLLKRYIRQDGLKAVPHLAKVIDLYDPTQAQSNSNEKKAASYAAGGLLTHIDANVVRLRGSEEGRQAIAAMKRLVERMQGAHFDIAEGDEHWKKMRYEGTLGEVKEMERINQCDQSIRNTFRLKYAVSLSDKQLLDFIAYMILLDASYPGWSEREEYKDLSERNEAGYPRWYVIMKNPEPFHKLYLQYTRKEK